MRKLTKSIKIRTTRVFADRRDDPRANPSRLVSGVTRVNAW
jgi:hypothetical protein